MALGNGVYNQVIYQLGGIYVCYPHSACNENRI